MELLQQQVAESSFSSCLLASRYPDQQAMLCMMQRAGDPRNMAKASCTGKAQMELLQLQVVGSPMCDWPADIHWQTSKL